MDTMISANEREILLMLLQKEENTLQIEINHTAHREFKSLLKERLQTIVGLIEKMKIAEPNIAF